MNKDKYVFAQLVGFLHYCPFLVDSSDYKTIVNYFRSRATNASAESFNAKIKMFRTQLRGVSDPLFFIFRLCKLFA